MPPYAHLFAGDGRRGADLVAYLDSLGAEQRAERYHQVQAFDLSAALPDGDAARGRETFGRYCSACHGTNAAGDGRFASELDGEALDLHKPGFRLVTWGPDGSVDNAAGTAAGHGALEQGLTRLIRWGLPGSDMPGHETLPVERIADLVAYVLSLQSLQPKQDAAAAPGVSPAGAP
jgi:cytochrome c oxidase cbb3-type subunit 2